MKNYLLPNVELSLCGVTSTNAMTIDCRWYDWVFEHLGFSQIFFSTAKLFKSNCYVTSGHFDKIKNYSALVISKKSKLKSVACHLFRLNQFVGTVLNGNMVDTR